MTPTTNNVESTTLLPCPFCGGEAELRYHPSCMRDPECRAWEVGCSFCDARVGSTVYATGKTKDMKLDEVTALYVGEAIDSDERDRDEARIFAEYAQRLQLREVDE